MRGETWVADLDPTRGHEEARTHPRLVVSDDRFNRGAAGLVVVPLTTVARGIPWHVGVAVGDGGVREESWAMVDRVRTLARERLIGEVWGRAPCAVMRSAEECLRLLLALG